jgi:hypothetical protein
MHNIKVIIIFIDKKKEYYIIKVLLVMGFIKNKFIFLCIFFVKSFI